MDSANVPESERQVGLGSCSRGHEPAFEFLEFAYNVSPDRRPLSRAT